MATLKAAYAGAAVLFTWMGSVMGGVNVAVLAWVMLTHAPRDRPPA
ncbi:MAG TPA: hypothetical protein VFF02_01220 [Anaeromyxobacteraceae bacterium]|nr:hypothetical protein [Anaeromyxobacteraceae bacterium]